MLRQNFVDVTISKHVTAEPKNVFIVFNFVSLIMTFRRNVKRSCDFNYDKCYRSDCLSYSEAAVRCWIFSRWVKNVGWGYGKYHVSSMIQTFVFLCRKEGSIKGYFL